MNKKYYIINKAGNVEQVSEEVAKTSRTYGIKDEESGHVFQYHTECDDPTCFVCNLAVCMVCGALEGALTTECCGQMLTGTEHDAIYKGKKDFRFGKWLEGVTNRTMAKDLETEEINQMIILEVFSEDIKKGTPLGKKIQNDFDRVKNYYI